MKIISKAPQGQIEFEKSDITVTIRPLKGRFTLKSIAVDKFPEINSLEGASYFELPAKELKEMIQQTSFAVSEDGNRHFMMGVHFEKENDKWLDLDLNMANGTVQIEERDFSKKGDAEAWLTSEAFDLKSTYSVEAEAAMARASELLKEGGDLDHEAINLAYQDLLKVLDFKDPFLLRFRYLCQKKGVSLK